jgi:metallo-beta-lactamase family protein
MKLQFLGANRQVTGSRYCLEAAGARVLVDCGMFQERDFLSRNWDTCPVPPREIDALLLTHAHIDHSGLIPRLVKGGFRGPIYATAATIDLAEIVLRDSAEIQMEDAVQKRRRHEKEGRREKYAEAVLYTEADVDRTLSRFEKVTYNKPFEVGPGLTAVYRDAGHILGSAMIEVSASQGGRDCRVVFSGDIGQWNRPLLHDPSAITQADYVIMESTYGDRDHTNNGDVATQLADVVNDTVGRGGNVVIPTFAVERAQELMYHLGRLMRQRKIKELPVFLDSPMAVDVMQVFSRHRVFFDEETWNLINVGESPLEFPGLHLVRTVDESKDINRLTGSAVIMATSGMCTGGRIKHHLRHNVTRPESTILFVGYQGQGTLGRQILEHRGDVRIHGQRFPMRARVAQLYGLSAHADRSGLLRWLSYFRRPPRQLFLTHGEEQVALGFAEHLRSALGWSVSVPSYLETAELLGAKE